VCSLAPRAELTGEGLGVLTFTTGARAQSAASALHLAGAHVVGLVPIGRVINPDFNEEAADLWATATSQHFDFDLCCLE
jgi:hypothetical protein